MLRDLRLSSGLSQGAKVLPERGIEGRGRRLHLDVPADGHAAGLEEVEEARGAALLPRCGGDDPVAMPRAPEIPRPEPREALPWMSPSHPAHHRIEDGRIDLGEGPAGDDVAEVVRPASNPRV